MVFSGEMPSTGIAGSYDNSILSLFRNLPTVQFCIGAVPIYIPTSSARQLPFPHDLSSIYCL